MPELPEVEVTRQGLAPHLEGRTVTGVTLRHSGLRWPFPPRLDALLKGHKVRATARRGKYLLLRFDHGTLIIHLGMSGHLRILPAATAPGKHDHIDIHLGSRVLRMNDPRRFGAVLWHGDEEGELENHVLLRVLGVEPLAPGFDAESLAALLFNETRGKKQDIKQALLAGAIVVGVGNIYASESLFKAGIRPTTAAGRVSLARYRKLAVAIQETLAEAIRQGGSTLRDFIAVNGQSGYFQQNYFVYARAGEPCRVCGAEVKQIVQGQRSTFYCAHCQK